ncbi:LuxR family transcriptional regulator [Salipiger aestuarii]|uniref:LuxR family transcriptional regulator n=1 Tax=Salipiger aestuarii TaxID=568098 RepID=UPI00123C3083|nr:LuxR family transcriptional regulator [Salipiger aestuarii]KAA8606637.1 LuxR family transcriptional regulator [Salipiger aestuarii]
MISPATRRHLLDLTNAASVEDLWAMHIGLMADYGFDRLLYGFTRYRTERSLGDPDDFVLLTNHTSAYTDVFVGQGLYRNAPMVNWALENEGACSWGVVAERMAQGMVGDAERKVIAFNVSQDVQAGYSISFQSVSSRTKGAIALTAAPGAQQHDVDSMWAEHGEDIMLMNNVLHLKILTLPYVPANQSLTKRQREALEWVGDGKSMQDIAAIMGLTQATIEKHLRLARDALNVETTAQAVAKAAFQNQMFIIDI